MSAAVLPDGILDFAPYRSLANEELAARVDAVRRQLGSRLLILGHHYQQDVVHAFCWRYETLKAIWASPS